MTGQSDNLFIITSDGDPYGAIDQAALGTAAALLAHELADCGGDTVRRDEVIRRHFDLHGKAAPLVATSALGGMCVLLEEALNSAPNKGLHQRRKIRAAIELLKHSQ